MGTPFQQEMEKPKLMADIPRSHEGEVRVPIGGSQDQLPSSTKTVPLELSQPRKGFKRRRHSKGTWRVYYKDIFHTLLNMPAYRFLLVFFGAYLLEFFIFALLYLSMREGCIVGEMGIRHAMWFSVQTASTIGYGSGPSPDPECVGVNLLIVFNIIVASLVDYMLMGIVFARFASPIPYASTVRFSSHAVMHLASDKGPLSGMAGPGCQLQSSTSGEHWCLSLRIANIRKHSLLKPEVILLLAVPPNATCEEMRFIELSIADLPTQITNMKLGLVASINHIITPDSPLYGLSLEAMEAMGIEVLCMLDGMDPMTSNSISAHTTYSSDKIRMNEHFETIRLKKNQKGMMGLDFGGFDSSVVVKSLSSGKTQEILLPTTPGGGPLTDTTKHATKSHMAELRRRTIRDLSADLPSTSSGGVLTEVLPGVIASPAVGLGHSPLGLGGPAVTKSVRELAQAILSDPKTPRALKDKAETMLRGLK